MAYHLALEGNSMFYESKKHLSSNSWHRVQHSACGDKTTTKLWMGHHHDLSDHKKFPDSLERSLIDVIYLPCCKFLSRYDDDSCGRYYMEE